MEWLRNLIEYRLAGWLLLVAMLLLLILHLLVFADVLPDAILWGDLATDETTLFFYELVAMAISLVFLVIVAAKLEYITARIPGRLLTAGLWAMALYFLINMLGNLASGITATTLVYGLVTLALALLSARVAID